MRAGMRSCRIEIWRKGDPTATGEPNPAPTLLKSVWASLIPIRGREDQTDRSRQSLTFYSARLEWLDGQGIDETDVVRLEGFEFGIQAILRDFTTKKTVDLTLIEQKQGA